jgi:hypothetical protein
VSLKYVGRGLLLLLTVLFDSETGFGAAAGSGGDGIVANDRDEAVAARMSVRRRGACIL